MPNQTPGPDLTAGAGDHAGVAETQGISPKAIAAAVWAFVGPLLLTGAAELVAYLVGNPGALEALPLWVQAPVLAMLATLSAGLAAYRANPGTVVTVKARD